MHAVVISSLESSGGNSATLCIEVRQEVAMLCGVQETIEISIKCLPQDHNTLTPLNYLSTMYGHRSTHQLYSCYTYLEAVGSLCLQRFSSRQLQGIKP